MNHIYNCSVNLYKEIYNNHFDYWAGNMPNNWKDNPYSGMDSTSDWHQIRMCLMGAIKKMADANNGTITFQMSPPGSYTESHTLFIENDTVVTGGANGVTTTIGTGGRFALIHSLDPTIAGVSWNAQTHYIPLIVGPGAYNISNLNGETSIVYTGSNDPAIANMHYFTLTASDGTIRTRSDYSVIEN